MPLALVRSFSAHLEQRLVRAVAALMAAGYGWGGCCEVTMAALDRLPLREHRRPLRTRREARAVAAIDALRQAGYSDHAIARLSFAGMGVTRKLLQEWTAPLDAGKDGHE